MKKTVLVFLALLLMSSQVYAGPMIYGYGAQSCGDFVKAMDGKRQKDYDDRETCLLFITWFLGLATAESQDSGEDVLHGRSNDSLALWLENYCKEHPLDHFSTASYKLLNALKKK